MQNKELESVNSSSSSPISSFTSSDVCSNKDPLVSVIIPIYNQEIFLRDAIESVIQQTYSNWEIILCDDGSTDASADICHTYTSKDSRIHYFRQDNGGEASARNLGIIHAKGNYFAMLDSDDLFHSKKLEILVKEFKKDPRIDIMYTGLRIINERGEVIGQYRAQNYPPESFLIHMFLRNEVAAHSVVMGKRECFKRFKYNQNYRHACDYDLLLRLAHEYRFKYLDLLLVDYRRHQQNMTNKMSNQWQGVVEILESFGYEHVASLISQSAFSEEEKNLLKGIFSYTLADYTQAIDLFQKISTPLGSFYLGNCYFKVKRLDDALISYQLAIKNDDKGNAACYNNLGLLYVQIGEIERAKECLTLATALRPGYLDAAHNLKNVVAGKTDHLSFTLRELRTQLMPYKPE